MKRGCLGPRGGFHEREGAVWQRPWLGFSGHLGPRSALTGEQLCHAVDRERRPGSVETDVPTVLSSLGQAPDFHYVRSTLDFFYLQSKSH